jgi:hypothetical protein
MFLAMPVITVVVKMNFFRLVVPHSVVVVEQQVQQVAQPLLLAVLPLLLLVSAVAVVAFFLVSVVQFAMQPAMLSLVSVTVGTTETADNWR